MVEKGPGVWYPLYTEQTFKEMQPESYPDIVRGDPTPALLDVFIMMESRPDSKKDSIEKVVQHLEFLDNPAADSMNYSMEKLYILGAINSEGVTDLGKIMSSCRMKLSHIRMILSGYVYNVYIPDLIIIALGILNKQNIIEDGKTYTLNNELLFKSAKLTKVPHTVVADEFIEMLFLWNIIQTKLSSRNVKDSANIDSFKKWCSKNGLSYSGIMEWISDFDDMLYKMDDMGFNVHRNISLLDSKVDKEFVETISNIKRCILEGFKLHVATWNEDLSCYISNRHKIKIKSWSPLLKVGNTPNRIIYDDTIMLYNKKSKTYVISVGCISVLDGWIAQEYDDRFTAARVIESQGSRRSSDAEKTMKDIWYYKQATSIIPTKESPIQPNDLFAELYEEKILSYSMITGGYQEATSQSSEKVGGNSTKKIMVF